MRCMQYVICKQYDYMVCEGACCQVFHVKFDPIQGMTARSKVLLYPEHKAQLPV